MLRASIRPPMDAARRWFLTTPSLAILAAPFAVAAQPDAKNPRIGWLTNSIVHAPNREAFLEGMQALGYRHVVIETRAAGGRPERLWFHHLHGPCALRQARGAPA